MELLDAVGLVLAAIGCDGDRVGCDLRDNARILRGDDVAGVVCRAELHAGTDERCLGAQQRNCLALHVGAHQCAVCVVVLEERNHRGGD